MAAHRLHTAQLVLNTRDPFADALQRAFTVLPVTRDIRILARDAAADYGGTAPQLRPNTTLALTITYTTHTTPDMPPFAIATPGQWLLPVTRINETYVLVGPSIYGAVTACAGCLFHARGYGLGPSLPIGGTASYSAAHPVAARIMGEAESILQQTLPSETYPNRAMLADMETGTFRAIRVPKAMHCPLCSAAALYPQHIPHMAAYDRAV